MARTFNRPPVQVDTPSGKDVKNYFFNHYNWKGLTDNKNVLAVDQETFSDCKNVYIDSEGLLRSRPSLKVKVVKYTNSGEEYVLSNVVNVWTFEFVTIYETLQGGIYYLTFVNSNVENHIQVPLQYVDEQGELQTYKDIKPIVADEKIFIFAENSFNYYDIKYNSYADASEFIHIPVTSVIVDGIADASAKVESPNILTTSYITKYLYTSTDSINFNNLVGKQVTVEVDGTSYVVNFKYNNQVVFVNRYTGLSEYNFADEYLLGSGANGVPLIQASDSDSVIVCSCKYVIDETTKKPETSWVIYHTTDGISFERVPDVENIIGMPKISKNGDYCFVFKDEGPYVYSLSSTGPSGKKYPEWRNLLKYINEDSYNSLYLQLNKTNDKGDKFNQSVVVNGCFQDDTTFAFVYGSQLVYREGDPKYEYLHCILVNDGVIEDITIMDDSPNRAVSNCVINPYYVSYDESTVVNIANLNGTHPLPDVTFNYVRADEATHRPLTCTVTNHSFYGNRANNEHFVSGTMTLSIDDSVLFTTNFEELLTNASLGFFKTVMYVYYGLGYNSNDDTYSLTISPRNAGVSLLSDYFPEDVKVSGFVYSMPNVWLVVNGEDLKVTVNLSVSPFDGVGGVYDCYVSLLRSTNTSRDVTLIKNKYSDANSIKSPIRYSMYTSSNNVFAKIIINDGVAEYFVTTVNYNNEYGSLDNEITNNIIYSHSDDGSNYSLIFSSYDAKIITNKFFFDYLSYLEQKEYEPIHLLFEAFPVSYMNALYLATENALYSNSIDSVITVSELSRGHAKFILPTHDALLSNYYFSEGNVLHISSPAVQLNVNSSKEIVTSKMPFRWYFPEINTENFDFDITNLHVISDKDVAIFFEHSVSYVNWDNEVFAYRYYKSKLQTGCKNGSDVLTTFDGKYTIFASNRGLVAMSYQDYIASTEQSLTYLSDTIYSVFENYISDSKSSNQVKLFKFGYWIVIYKPDSDKGFIFDIRNNSWWPVAGIDNSVKFVNIDNSVKLLSNGKMYELNKLDTDYFDYDGEKHTKIDWFVKSQKLHLNALNNYKHISNITFVSVHDSNILQNSEYNINELDFKLQVNCYRKEISGNIDEDDFVNVNYKVETIRTFVQRLNYSKINEFQYQLSSDEENAIEIPLSLNSITIKYKIGGQVR